MLLFTNRAGNQQIFITQIELCNELYFHQSNIQKAIYATTKYGTITKGLLKGCKLELLDRHEYIITLVDNQ